MSVNSRTNYSTRGNSFKETSKKEAEKFCNACYKAGKEKSLYTSHFPKSVPGPHGIVVCPTILAACCKYCGQSGHWANEKHCAAMRADAKRNQMYQRVERRSAGAVAGAVARPIAKDVKLVTSQYAALMESDDDSDNDEQLVGMKRSAAAVAAAVPKPVKPVEAVLPKAGVSWASMAAAPKPVVKKEETIYYSSNAASEYVPLTPGEIEAYRILSERRSSGAFEKRRTSWLDLSDDEEEEEDDVYEDNSAW